jgi:hypothetical protein
VLPLVEQHISESEWAEGAERGMASIPKDRLLVFIGYLMEDTTPAERAHFSRRVPLPGRVAYRLIGQRKHRAEAGRIRGQLAVSAKTPGAR